MFRRLLVPLAVLAVLLVAAVGTLAAVSVGGGDGENDVSGAREQATPTHERERERERDEILDRFLPELEPLLPRQPFIGIVLSEEDGAVVVAHVLPGSPATRAGVHEGDVVEAVNGAPIEDPAEVAEIVRESERGDTLVFRVRREDGEHQVEVQVGLRPFAPELRRGGLPSLPGPDELSELFGLPGLRGLPGRFGELFERFIEGGITFLDEHGERTSLHVLAGTIVEVSDDGIVVSPNGDGSPHEFAVTDDTHILRGLFRPTDLDDLESGDWVVVVTRDDSGEASFIFAIPAFGEETED